MKLLVIYLYALKNAGHFEFVHSVMEFALRCAGVSNHLMRWFSPFKEAVENEDRLMQVSLKNVISEQLAKLDGQRDGLVSSVHGATNAMLKSLDSEKVAAAEKVMNELTSLKVDIQDNYMNQTGQIDTLTTVLLDRYEADLQKLELLGLVQELKAVNDLMHTLMNRRDEEQMARMNDSLAKARLVTDAAYDAFIRAVESYTYINEEALAEDDEGFTKFVNDTNARIEYFRRYVLKINSVPEFDVPGGGETTVPDEPTDPTTPPTETEPEETVPEDAKWVTVTFKYQGTRDKTVEREYFVGQRVTTANAPENDEGWAWKYLPFTMPDCDGFTIQDCLAAEADDEWNRKVLIRWYNTAEGMVEQYYNIGETVVAPEPPAGMHWNTDIIGKPAIPMRVSNFYPVADA